jgi:hypothetical protein
MLDRLLLLQHWRLGRRWCGPELEHGDVGLRASDSRAQRECKHIAVGWESVPVSQRAARRGSCLDAITTVLSQETRQAHRPTWLLQQRWGGLEGGHEDIWNQQGVA